MTYEDAHATGDHYVFVAMDADSKLVISYLVGKRSARCTQAMLTDLRARVLGKPQITTDGFAPYPMAVGQTFGPDADFAIIEKQYAVSRGNEAAVRYSPGRIRSITKKVVSGLPDPALISTSYIERQNLTMRMQMRRFTRLTNGFSKRLRNLEAAVALHFLHFNLCREHETTRTTPAVAARLTAHVWSVAELVETVLSADMPTPAPTPPAPKQPRLPGLRVIRERRS